MGRMNQKLEPAPCTDSHPMVPPCISTRRFESARPSPVPCACRLAELSTWLNSLKSLGWSSGRIPMPVSRTETQMASRETSRGCSPARSEGKGSGARVARAATVTRPPSGVNFDALESRL